MRFKNQTLVMLFLIALVSLVQCSKDINNKSNDNPAVETANDKKPLLADGKHIFRYDTFGDEEFWSGLLHIDKAIAGAANGGFGPGVSPNTALAVGLKVDYEALPSAVVAAILSGDLSLNDPATTLALLKLDAVVGVKGFFTETGALDAIGITCASCHSTVDNSFAPGIGKRLDGWPNRDLNVGAIISLTDNALPIANMLHVTEPTLRSVLNQWGPGKFSAILFMDGKALRPDGSVAANLIPAAFGLKNVSLTTYTGWGDITYWNSFVGTLEMHGKGTFLDTRLNDPVKYPIAVENNFWNVVSDPDLLTSKLPALKAYQHSIDAPKPSPDSYNHAAAAQGRLIFNGKADCASCHPSPIYADNILHTAAEIGIDDFDAMRSPTGKYRTTPLGGLFTRTRGGFYHDGRFANLPAVVNHYNNHFSLNLTNTEKNNLVEFLKSL